MAHSLDSAVRKSRRRACQRYQRKVRLLESIAERLPILGTLNEDWQPISAIASTAWAAFYVVLQLGAAIGGAEPGSNGGLLRWFDLVFVPIHEGGHLLFGYSGSMWIMVAGGTLMQLGVPLALAVYFLFQRQIAGTAFCIFFFFEQFLPVATYMADSRTQSLTYVTVGDTDAAVHDWFYLFSSVGLLDHDTQIAAVVRTLGWLGMLAVVAWLVMRAWQTRHVRPA
jgi:hypothetical protein